MKITRRAAIATVLTAIPATLKAEGGRHITISYPNGALSWPLFVAKEGGCYAKYGLYVDLVLGVHPAGVAMLVNGEAQALAYSLEQLLLASTADRSIALISCPTNRGGFALMAWKDIVTVKDLKGRNIGVGQVGDANYSFTAALLRKAGLSSRDINWVPLGPSLSSRAVALTSRRIDAAIFTAPAYFKLVSGSIKMLVDFSQDGDIYVSSAIAMKKGAGGINRELARDVLKAQVEAVGLFYRDKEFSVSAYMRFDATATRADTERLYDLYAKSNTFERVPYVLREAVEATITQNQDEQLRNRLGAFDFTAVVDNSVTEELSTERFFQRVFGRGIEREIALRRQGALGWKVP